MMRSCMNKIIIPLTIVAVIAIISIEKEKIEVDTTSHFNQN